MQQNQIFYTKKGEAFNEAEFQKFMGYSDEEMTALKANPRKFEYAQKITEEEFRNKYIVVEVLESHGCEAGMRPGDKLYLDSLCRIDPKRSDPFCIYAITNLHAMANGFRTYVLHGENPNTVNMVYAGCMDTGSSTGLGRVVVKMTVVDKSELPEV